MDETFVVTRDKLDPGTVRIAGRVPRARQADLAGALSREARRGIRRLDLTGLDVLSPATAEVLLVLAAEVELELLVRAGGSLARKVRQFGLDSLAAVRDLPAAPAWVAASA
jgi:hypothetical protein